MAKKTIQLNEAKLRNLIAECVKNAIMEGGGYDMSTPEGRAGAENRMRYVMPQSESDQPREAEEAADAYCAKTSYPNTAFKAFKAGVEWAIKNIIHE